MSWYQGKIPREWILTVSVSKTMPQEAVDEQWSAKDLKARCVRCGSTLYLVGKKIPPVKGMFRNFLSLRQAEGLELLDLSDTEDLSGFFEGCASLQDLDLNGWNVSSVKNLSRMFKDCRSLRTLHIDTWDTASAEDLSQFCAGCIALETIDVSAWKLEKVQSISCLFLECNKLPLLEVSHWNVTQVRDFSHCFACCYCLQKLDVSAWETLSAVNMEGLFSRCKELKVLDISRWNTDSVRNFRKMFFGCEKLKVLDLRGWSFGEKILCSGMFLGMNGQLKLPHDRRFRTLAKGDSWFRKALHSGELRYISSIQIQKKCKKPDWFEKCWAADCLDSAVLQVYKKGEELLLDCRGGVLYSHENSIRAFSIPDEEGRSWISRISGLELLNSRYTYDFRLMFGGNHLLLKPEESLFTFRKGAKTERMFEGCREPQPPQPPQPKLRIIK